MHCGLNVCVPPENSHVEILVPSVMAFKGEALGRGLGHEGGALINGISVPIKEAPESSLTPSAMRGHREMTVSCEPGGGTTADQNLLAP